MSQDAQAKTERMILGECPLPKETRIIEICPFHRSGNPFLPITVEYKIDIGPQISAHQPQLPHDFPLFAVNQTTTWRFSSNHAGGVKGINNGGNQFCVLVTFHTDQKKKKKKKSGRKYITFPQSESPPSSFHPNLPHRFPSCVPFRAISWNVLAGFTTRVGRIDSDGSGLGMFLEGKSRNPH